VVESIANYYSSVPSILKAGMHVIGQKACGRSHLFISMFITQPGYWLIMNHGFKLPYDWSLYTTLTEEWNCRMSYAVKNKF
jgi:hypothetical protein